MKKGLTHKHMHRKTGVRWVVHSDGVALPMLQSGAAARFSGPEQRVGCWVSVGGLAGWAVSARSIWEEESIAAWSWPQWSFVCKLWYLEAPSTLAFRRSKVYYCLIPTLGNGFDNFLWSKGTGSLAWPCTCERHTFTRDVNCSLHIQWRFSGSPHQTLTNVPTNKWRKATLFSKKH